MQNTCFNDRKKKIEYILDISFKIKVCSEHSAVKKLSVKYKACNTEKHSFH